MFTIKHIIKFENCEKSQIIDKLVSYGCENIAKLNRIGSNYVVASLSSEQVSIVADDENVVSVAPIPKARPSSTLYTTSGRSIFVDATQNFTLTGTGKDFLSGTHYYNTTIDTKNEQLLVGVNEADNSAFTNFDYVSYWTGRDVDIVIFDVDKPSQKLSGHDYHPDLTISESDLSETRVKRINWAQFSPSISEPFNTQLSADISIWSSHATGAASAAAGWAGGFAKEANIYVIHASENDSVFECMEAISSWSLNKPVNDKTGLRNPTIVYFGWAFDQKSHFVKIDEIESFEVAFNQIGPPLDGWDLNEFLQENIPLVRLNYGGSIDWAVRVNPDFTTEEQLLDESVDLAIDMIINAGGLVVGAPKNDSKVFSKKSDIRALDKINCIAGHTLYTVNENFLTPEYLGPTYEDFIAPNPAEWAPAFDDLTYFPQLEKNRTAWEVVPAESDSNQVTFKRRDGGEELPYPWQNDADNTNFTVTLWEPTVIAEPASYRPLQAPIGMGGDYIILVTSLLGSDYANTLHWSSPRGSAFEFAAHAGGSGFRNITAERPIYQTFGSFQPNDTSLFYNTAVDDELVRWGMFGGTSAAAATIVGLLAVVCENLTNRLQAIPTNLQIVEAVRLFKTNNLMNTWSMYTGDLSPTSSYLSDAFELSTSDGTENLNLGMVQANIEWDVNGNITTFTNEYGLVDLFETERNLAVILPESIYFNAGLITFDSDDILQPKPPVVPEVEQRFYFGLNVNNSLSDIVDEAEALRNLYVDINDLDRIRNIRGLGVTPDDLKLISGLDTNVRKEVKAIRQSYIGSEFLQRDLKNDQFIFDEIVSKMKFQVDSRIISRSYKYTYADPEPNTQIKFADVSTSRISSWSSFDDDNINAPIFYAGDVEVTKNAQNRSTIYASELSTKIKPITRKYSSEVPTHLVTINVDGEDKQFYAMSGIPLNFYGRFRRIVDGGLAHAVTREISDPKPVWSIENLDETGTYFDFKDLDDEQSVSFLDFRTRPRLVQFYYNPDLITKLNVIDIGMLTLPQANLTNLQSLNIASNDLKVMPDFLTFSPNVIDLVVSDNDLRRAEFYTPAYQQLKNIPSSVETLDLTATLQHNETDVQYPSLSHLTNLRQLVWKANGTRTQIAHWETVPTISRNFNEPTVSPNEVEPYMIYEIIDLGDGDSNPRNPGTWTNYIDNFSIGYDTLREEIPSLQTVEQTSGQYPISSELYEATGTSSGSYVMFKEVPPSGTGVLKPALNDTPFEILTYQNHLTEFKIQENGSWPLRFEPRISDTILHNKELKNIDIVGNGTIGTECGEFNTTIDLLPTVLGDKIEEISFNACGMFPTSMKFKTNLQSYNNERADADYKNTIHFQQIVYRNWDYSKNDISVSGENIFEGCVSLKSISMAQNSVFMNLENMFQLLPVLEEVSIDNLIYGKFSRTSFAGCPGIKTLRLASPHFGIITRAPWVTEDSLFDPTGFFTDPDSGRKVSLIHGRNKSHERFFESDCLFDLQQLETLSISGSNISEATNLEYNEPDVPETPPGSPGISYAGYFALGPLPDFSRNTNLVSVDISNLYVNGALPDFEGNIKLQSLSISGLKLTRFTAINSISLKTIAIIGCPLATDNITPMPAINAPSLIGLQLSDNLDLGGPIPNMNNCPLLESIVIVNCSFESYTIGGFSGLFNLKEFDADNCELKLNDIRQIIKDVYVTYLTNPRSNGKLVFKRNPGSDVTAVLSDPATLQAYNILVNIANWTIIFE